MKVKFWGTRGSIAVPGRDTIVYGGNTTCLEITLEGGRKVIVDAGTGIRPLGRQLCDMEEDVDIHLLITHIHWDHVLGFPFFDPVYDSTSKIAIDGSPACIKGLKIPFENRMGDGFWPIKFDDLKAQIRYLDSLSHGPLRIDNAVIDTIPLQHPQGGVGFRFRDGEKTLVFLTDNELREDAWSGRNPNDYVRFCKDADILIHDAQYTPEEWKIRKGWGHTDYVTTLRMAIEANVQRLLLFHHDPSRKDPDLSAIETHCNDLAREMNVDMVIDAAREGSELTI